MTAADLQRGLTRSHLGEPGGAGVEVNGLKAHHLAGLRALADGHAHQGVLLLRDHQHLKHLEGAGQGEVKVLRQEEGERRRTVECQSFSRFVQIKGVRSGSETNH